MDNPEKPMVEAEVEAEFTLESPAACPACRQLIDVVHVVRLLRTRVNFVSGLPRRGHLMTCPKCSVILSGGLGGLL